MKLKPWQWTIVIGCLVIGSIAISKILTDVYIDMRIEAYHKEIEK